MNVPLGFPEYLTWPWETCRACAVHMRSLPEDTATVLAAAAQEAGTTRHEQTVAYFEKYHEAHD